MRIERLGRLGYEEARAAQMERVRRVQADPRLSFLLLVEHPPIYTLGRFGSEKNILETRGAPVRRVERGGDVTYHGPGQLVGYVILDLYRGGWTVRGLVGAIERVLVGVAAAFGVKATRRKDRPGVWVRDRKLASIGLAVSRRVTYHGLALNVHTDLSAFDAIVPCGIAGCRMTSLSRELGREVSLEEAASKLHAEAEREFGHRAAHAPPEHPGAADLQRKVDVPAEDVIHGPLRP
jgi:lipoyl(octanoyl) transferase